MSSSLADRLRDIVGARRAGTVPVVTPGAGRTEGRSLHGGPHGRALRAAAGVLGGEWLERADGPLILVDRFYPAGARHGRASIASIVEHLSTGRGALAVLGRAWPSARDIAADLVFLDLETTGLAGGAGTQAFLVGCATVEGDGLRVRQWLLPGFEHERALLAEVSAWAEGLRALVTFNGRTFDVPLIETRFLYHRLSFPLGDLPHLDMLHPARRLWKRRPSILGPPADQDSCRLDVLERHIAGVHRVSDVPGLEIPARYFQFIRDGDARPLEAVLEHNRQDLLSLALVTAHTLDLIERGPSATAHPAECLALGRLYECAGGFDEAEACYLKAADLSRRVGYEPAVRADALGRLARCRRRAGRPHEAFEAWRELASLSGSPAALRREAREALAIYYEHRTRHLESARTLVLEVLNEDQGERQRAAAEHRLRRLERKLQRPRGGLMMALDFGH
jgi:uncharacterized protein YprB with RNaseH-like and TPR domain